jgi:hypothetical protein
VHAHPDPQRHWGPQAHASCVTAVWQPQLQLEPGQELQAHTFFSVSFTAFS